MTKMIIIGSVLLLSLTACSDKNTDDGGTPENTVQVLTNTSQCTGRTPAKTSIYSNRWMTQARLSNGVILTSVSSFKRGRTNVTMWAQYKDQIGKVSVSTDIEERGNSFTTEESETSRDSILVDGRPYPFSLKFPKRTLRYKFKGPCLLVEGSEVSTLVPYRR